MVLGIDSIAVQNSKAAKIMTKQLEDARKMLLYTRSEPLDLKALTFDVLMVLCEEMGVDVR